MRIYAAIVDYGLGNLFSIRQACRVVGLDAEVTSDRAAIMSASVVILPGVGAFGDAMAALKRRDLINPLRDYAAAGRPLFGVCLGMQLLMEESEEFGRHAGLGLIPGSVTRLPAQPGWKVPQIGWNRVEGERSAWRNSPLDGIPGGAYFYFVHSYRVQPNDCREILAESRFAELQYCSAIRRGSIFGVQFHPEKSGRDGLAVYTNLLRLARSERPLVPAT